MKFANGVRVQIVSEARCFAPLPATERQVRMTEADCIEADMAMHRWKMAGGPARDNQVRAERLDRQWSEVRRLGGVL